ncbi:MAG: hypothetical protein JNL72_07950 [Flavipsychrobacter sp.]|nr:hypothetical protein [Flavipsychrobacter sp.]
MKKRETWIVILCLLIAGVFWTYHLQEKRGKIKNSPSFSTGKVIKFNSVSKRSSIVIVYQFNLNDKVYRNTKSYTNISINWENKFVGHFFTIVYEPKNPKNNEILITDEDYEYYNLKKPDSLYWVEQYFTQ